MVENLEAENFKGPFALLLSRYTVQSMNLKVCFGGQNAYFNISRSFIYAGKACSVTTTSWHHRSGNNFFIFEVKIKPDHLWSFLQV